MKITKKQIKNIFGYVSKESDILIMLRRFYWGTTSELLAINKINDSIFQITAPNGTILEDLFVIKSGVKKIKYELIQI